MSVMSNSDVKALGQVVNASVRLSVKEIRHLDSFPLFKK